MIWVLVLVIAVIVLALLIEPYFRKTAARWNIDEKDYLVAQLDDVARDRAAGLLSEEEAVEAEKEAQRRLLAASKAEQQAPRSEGPIARQISTMIIGAAPLAAIVLYVFLGNPTQQATPEALEIAQRAQMSAPGGASAPSLAQSVNALEQHLADNPDDLDGWIMLGESYARMDRFAEAATAFGRARELAPDRAYLHAAEGEALTMANGGVVNEEATAALQRALERDDDEPRARFYLALGAYQSGKKEEALGALVALANDAPSGVQWAPIVRSQIEVIAAELGRPVNELGLKVAPAEQADDESQDARRGPTQQQAQAAAEMSAEERTAMIENMVEGLAARLENEPDDLEGWTMLARSHAVLGDMQKSADAYAQAIELAPDDINLRLGRAEALLTILREKGEPVDEEAKAAIDDVSRLDPEHPFALYFQGLAASQRGDKARAKSYWERLLATMPEGSPEAASVQRMIDAL